ncbi:unnamed protein product [Discosporangium mesarthrocarpum]
MTPGTRSHSLPTPPCNTCTQLRLESGKRIIRRFRKTDPAALLVDLAAQKLSEADGKPLEAGVEVVVPGGKRLIPEQLGSSATLETEGLGGASILVQRSRIRTTCK